MQINGFNDFRPVQRFRLANCAVQVVLSLCLVVSLNYLASKYFARIDLNESGIYTLAPESKAYIRRLEEPIEIFVTIPNDPGVEELGRMHQHLSKLFREYEAAAMRDGQAYIKIEYVDVYRQRKRALELANKYNLTQENSILVTMGTRIREINQAELYEVEGDQITGFCGERVITSAIINVSSEDKDTIYFLMGHGEMRLDDVDPGRGLSQLEAFLRERNYVPASLDLSVIPEVPEDADLVVVPSPQASLFPEEVEKLRRYMSERNGRMIVLVDPGRLHGMEDLFYDWGILVEDMSVVEKGPDSRAQGGDLIIRRFARHPITELLLDYRITALWGQPRPVRKDPASLNDSRLKVDPFIGTSEQSWGERDYRTQDVLAYDANRDLEGPISIAAVSTRSAGTDLNIAIPQRQLVVFGNSDFIANNRFGIFGNRTLFFNSVNWALSRNNLLNIPTRSFGSYQVTISNRDLKQLFFYFAMIPLATAFLGLSVFFIRRR